MSGFLLDTNNTSDIIRNPFGSAARRVEAIDPKRVCTSIIVAAELRYGCARKGSTRLTAKVEGILETMAVMPLDMPADAIYGLIRAQLEAAGQPLGRALNLTLVTGNTKERAGATSGKLA